MPRKTPEHQLELFDEHTGPDSPSEPIAPHPVTPSSGLAREPGLMPPWHIARPAALPAHATWREITLDGDSLGFVLRRSRRKTIGLMIHDDGLQVQAPSWSTLAQVEHVVREKSAWILRKLTERAQNLRLLALQENPWRAGGRIPYLGVQVMLRLDGAHAAHYQGDIDAPVPSDILCLPLPGDALADRIRDSACTWLQQRAQIDFSKRLDDYLSRANQTIQGWRLSSASGRWGSCSSARRIMLNWRLIHFEPTIIDYVVAHEVAHLRIMNHGPEFWQELGRLYPDFKRARDTLRQHQPATLPLI